MYNLRNRIQLIGHLGAAPEVKTMESGKKLARFSLATNENYTNADGERVKETTWHTLVAWGKTADLAEKFLQKGSEIVAEGKLLNRSFTDKQGAKKSAFEIEVHEIVLLGGREKASS